MADDQRPATEHQIRAAKLVEELWNDPELGAQIQARAKKKFDDVVTADQTFAPVVEPLKKENKELRAELDEIKKSLSERSKAEADSKAEAEKKSFEQKIANARDSYNLTEEGFDKMVARMKDTGNYSDPEAAAAWVALKNPPTQAAGPTVGPTHMNLFGTQKADEAFAELHRGSGAYRDSQIDLFLRNPDKYVADTFGNA